ncbi:uncharacterized protein BO95DRAFT_208906 [Aspergillus brunneoviolaceus CBS 621.78]|uniref:Uncharacterized protein n=1 Tax=Aspergillus brunneoviolaceus CBS 621.78 TaxID=1450534 RepID=A0ACD1G2C4_9EURO|nr:hypothetical protein BO95DRAFT_208906 [Aspergillus brunneoviolaceus CBS 621.78]RAH43358.1 hypothetical protein BO95DRAFT_208906 [Aspergillus brunneoviolaceus CBS 621.78]
MGRWSGPWWYGLFNPVDHQTATHEGMGPCRDITKKKTRRKQETSDTTVSSCLRL